MDILVRYLKWNREEVDIHVDIGREGTRRERKGEGG